jgi:hypothetical protein
MQQNDTPLDRRGLFCGLLALALAGLYQALWWLAPGLMAAPLWNGATIPVSVPLGVAAIYMPLLLAWLCIRHDRTER